MHNNYVSVGKSELTVTQLDSMNSELLVTAQQLREKWLQEKNEMSGLVVQLRSSVEREMKEKEQMSLEVSAIANE